jgi:O-antigen ligase
VVAHAPRRFDGGRYSFVVSATFLIILAALGGASRVDELQQPVVAFAALAAIGAALWPLDFAPFRDVRGVLVAIALVYALVLVQLLPLPAAIWAALPGHDIYAGLARDLDSGGWRPATLSPDLTISALAGLLPATALALLALMLDFRSRVRLTQLIVAIACASALLGLVQIASGGTALHLFRTSSADSAVGLFANRNHEAVLMALCLPLVTAIATIKLREGASPGRVVGATGAILILFLIAVAATGSRMGLLLGAVGLIGAGAIWLLCGERVGIALPRRPGMWAATIAAALVALVPIALLMARSGTIHRLTSRDAIEQTRLAALDPMMEAARAFLPFGAGFGTFDPVYQRFEPNALLSTIYLNQAHNEPMQLAIEGGIAALALLALFLLWWIAAAFRAVRPRESAPRRAMGIAAAAGTLILMLSSLVDYPLRTPLLSSLFALLCVEMVRSAHKRTRAPAPPDRATREA